MLFEQEQHHGKVAEDLGVYWPSLRNKSSGVSNCEDYFEISMLKLLLDP